jgi:hypothetical protein
MRLLLFTIAILPAFGEGGLQCVLDMLRGEMIVAMAQSGIPNLAAFDRSLVEFLPGTQRWSMSARRYRNTFEK